jgi:hypothetical protein
MAESKTNNERTPEATAAESKLKQEASEFFSLLGSAVSMTVQGITQRVWVKLDRETCRRLDMLVNCGAADSRSEAAAFLIAEGIKVSQPVFQSIDDTNTQIATLLTQLQNTGLGEESA